MESLTTIVAALDQFFDLANAAPDLAFSRFLPKVYQAESRPWRSWMEPAFVARFNGLMVRGAENVRTVFLASFPSVPVLATFLDRAEPGDLLFLHHPVDLESGDPRGEWGRFFQPIADDTILALAERKLSIYSCHAPLDYHPTLSTSRSIAAALGATITDQFFPFGPGHAGLIATVPPIGFAALESRLCQVFGLPYVDIAGARPAMFHTLAMVAGSGDRVEQMKIAESKGAQAYISGEIHSRIDTDRARRNFAEVEEYAKTTGMALLGVSHAGSEFLIMDREMREWFAKRFAVATVPLPEAHWWR